MPKKKQPEQPPLSRRGGEAVTIKRETYQQLKLYVDAIGATTIKDIADQAIQEYLDRLPPEAKRAMADLERLRSKL